MNIYQCDTCRKTFKTQGSLRGHKRIHGPSKGTSHRPKCCHLVTKREIDAAHLASYDASLRICENCGVRNTTTKFCSRSCSASLNNKSRVILDETKKKTSIALKIYNASKPTNPKTRNPKVERKLRIGPFSKLYTCTCAHCYIKFVNRRQVKYCNQHNDLYKSNNRNRYRFTFSLSKFPDIFGDYSILLRQYGMWSPTNTSGLTRDHKVSVNEAIRNNYDPYYITHPLNCELMPWHDNNKKNTECSLLYSDLVRLVDEYDSH